MPLRLAGEEQAQVLGLDGRGWVREVQAPDGGYSLKLPDATSAAKGLLLGGDAALYRSAAGTLRLPDKVRVERVQGENANVYIDVGAGGSGSIEMRTTGSRDVALIPGGGKIDCQARLYNSGSADGGAVAVADAVRVAGPIDAWDNLDSGSWQVALNPAERAAYLKFRTTELDPGADGEGILYLAEVGGARKLVAKVRSGGVVYTGTLALA
ncbi:MAG: hypothetical protein AAB369_02190 [Chloroflexota bacterium]